MLSSKKDKYLLGSILTVCKGIDKADDVKLDQSSKLVLVPEPTNKYDKNAVRVCLMGEFSTPHDESLTTGETGHLFCGYLPKKLVHHIAKYFEEKTIQIECVLLPPCPLKKTGLTCVHALWASFDVQINFYTLGTLSGSAVGAKMGNKMEVSEEGKAEVEATRAPAESLKTLIALLNEDVTSRI